MSTKVIVSIIIFLLLIVGVLALYFYVEKPFQEDQFSSINMSVTALDGEINIRTNYIVYVDNVFFINKTTSNKAAVLLQVPANKSILIYNENVENQTYYTYVEKINTTMLQPYRITLKLIKPNKFNITQEGNLSTGSIIKLDLKSNQIIKNLVLCMNWGLHTIYMKVINQTENKDLIKYDKCFNINNTNQSSSVDIYMDHKIFGIFDDKDFVNITFLNYDNIPFQTNKKYNIVQLYETK